MFLWLVAIRWRRNIEAYTLVSIGAKLVANYLITPQLHFPYSCLTDWFMNLEIRSCYVPDFFHITVCEVASNIHNLTTILWIQFSQTFINQFNTTVVEPITLQLANYPLPVSLVSHDRQLSSVDSALRQVMCELTSSPRNSNTMLEGDWREWQIRECLNKSVRTSLNSNTLLMYNLLSIAQFIETGSTWMLSLRLMGMNFCRFAIYPTSRCWD